MTLTENNLKYCVEESGYRFDDFGCEYEYDDLVDYTADSVGTLHGDELYIFGNQSRVPDELKTELTKRGIRYDIFSLHVGELLVLHTNQKAEKCLTDTCFGVYRHSPAYGSTRAYAFYPSVNEDEGKAICDEMESYEDMKNPFHDCYSVEAVTPYGVVIETFSPYDD